MKNGRFRNRGKNSGWLFVWNIGENMGTHEYIPVCEDLHPEYKDNYEINTATLKAVKVTPDEWKNSTKRHLGELETLSKQKKH